MELSLLVQALAIMEITRRAKGYVSQDSPTTVID